LKHPLLLLLGAGIAQWYSAGLRAGHRIQTGSETHSAFYPMGTGDKRGRDMNLTTHLLPVPRSRTRGGIPPPPVGLHGVVLS